MFAVVGRRNAAELHLDPDDPVIGSLDDEVDFPTPGMLTQMENPRFRMLRGNAHTQRRQRFEQRPEQHAIAADDRGHGGSIEQRMLVRTEQPEGERRIDELVLRRDRQSAER